MAVEVAVRLLGMNLGDVAGQLQAGLVGMTGGSLVQGTDQLPVRVRLGDGLRGDLAAISDLPVLLPGAAVLSASGKLPVVPLSELARPVLEPAESVITRRNGERTNTVQAFIVPGLLPEEALQSVLKALDDSGFAVDPADLGATARAIAAAKPPRPRAASATTTATTETAIATRATPRSATPPTTRTATSRRSARPTWTGMATSGVWRWRPSANASRVPA